MMVYIPNDEEDLSEDEMISNIITDGRQSIVLSDEMQS